MAWRKRYTGTPGWFSSTNKPTAQSSLRAGKRSLPRPVTTLSAGSVNSTPSTDAPTIVSQGSGPRRSTRAPTNRSIAWGSSVGTSRRRRQAPSSALRRAPVSSNELRRCSRKKGLPSAPRLMALTKSSGAAPPRRARASSSSASSVSGPSSEAVDDQAAFLRQRGLQRRDPSGRFRAVRQH